MRRFDVETASDLTLGALRVAVGGFLVWGAATKMFDAARFDALVGLWSRAGLPQPDLLASLSVGVQFALGALLLIGLFTRFAGLVNGVNFAAAALITGVFASSGVAWALLMLVVLTLHFGLLGGGRWSIDGLRAHRLAMARAKQETSIETMLASLGIQPGPGDRNNPGGR